MQYKKEITCGSNLFLCDPAGARTQDPNIKSVVLYLLSYWIFRFGSAKICQQNYISKFLLQIIEETLNFAGCYGYFLFRIQ